MKSLKLIIRSFRLPEDILDWLKKSASKSCRSTNAELLHVLRRAKEEKPVTK